jgi:hypothetical protein
MVFRGNVSKFLPNSSYGKVGFCLMYKFSDFCLVFFHFVFVVDNLITALI